MCSRAFPEDAQRDLRVVMEAVQRLVDERAPDVSMMNSKFMTGVSPLLDLFDILYCLIEVPMCPQNLDCQGGSILQGLWCSPLSSKTMPTSHAGQIEGFSNGALHSFSRSLLMHFCRHARSQLFFVFGRS